MEFSKPLLFSSLANGRKPAATLRQHGGPCDFVQCSLHNKSKTCNSSGRVSQMLAFESDGAPTIARPAVTLPNVLCHVMSCHVIGPNILSSERVDCTRIRKVIRGNWMDVDWLSSLFWSSGFNDGRRVGGWGVLSHKRHRRAQCGIWSSDDSHTTVQELVDCVFWNCLGEVDW